MPCLDQTSEMMSPSIGEKHKTKVSLPAMLQLQWFLTNERLPIVRIMYIVKNETVRAAAGSWIKKLKGKSERVWNISQTVSVPLCELLLYMICKFYLLYELTSRDLGRREM